MTEQHNDGWYCVVMKWEMEEGGGQTNPNGRTQIEVSVLARPVPERNVEHRAALRESKTESLRQGSVHEPCLLSRHGLRVQKSKFAPSPDGG